jgi:hypothetical protein
MEEQLDTDEEVEPYSDGRPVAVGTFREELRLLPSIQRWVVYVSGFCMTMLLVQCFFIMPVILIKYGWGFNLHGDGH